MTKNKLAIIGGSGLYDVEEFKEREFLKINTPWGKPSDEILKIKYKGKEVCFLPRHGKGHFISPSKINFRANIDALKQLGVTDIVSVSAVGSLKEECIDIHNGGTYVVMVGPQFSTLAESNFNRSWKADVIGMTNMPESKLAREAEIRYASVSMVTDYDCWHPDHENVDVQQVIKVLLGNAAKAKNMIKNLIENFENYIDPKDPTNNCLDVAIITTPEKRTQKTKDKLKTVAGRALNK